MGVRKEVFLFPCKYIEIPSKFTHTKQKETKVNKILKSVLTAGALMSLALPTTAVSAQTASTQPPAVDPGVQSVLTPEQQGAVPLSMSAGSCLATGDFESAFRITQMKQYLDCFVYQDEQWIDALYHGAMPHPNAYYFIPDMVVLQTACGPASDKELAFCPGDRNVYLGERAVLVQYLKYGDAAAVVVVAHEVTHSFQAAMQMTVAQTPNEQIRYENQADCGAGAFMADHKANMNGDDDIMDLSLSLIDAADSESLGNKRTHGTDQQRIDAFNLGYQDGNGKLENCNDFVPETPIMPTN